MLFLQSKSISELKRATYLSERVTEKSVLTGNSKTLAKEWIDQTGLSESMFSYRLAEKQLTNEEFVGLLINKDNPQQKTYMQWEEILDNVFHSQKIKKVNLIGNYNGIGLFVLPFVKYFHYSITKKFEYAVDADYWNFTSVLKESEYTIYNELRYICSKTVVLDFHRIKKEQDIKGEFFQKYKEEYLKNEEYLIQTLKEFPVLARTLAEVTQRFILNICSVFERFIHDYTDIRKAFLDNENTRLEYISIGLGDSHKGGQQVSIFTFQDNKKIVYKPRSLDIDYAFARFTEWINGNGLKYPLKNLSILSTSEYGWQEFAESKESDTDEDILKYYYRTGVLLGIFRVLGSNDMHYENIIASGEHPFIIDLETLLSNQLYSHNENMFPIDLLSKSILGSGLLPTGSIFNSNIDTDISGLGGVPKQQSKNINNWVLVNDNTDFVRFEKQPFITFEEKHLVKKEGEIKSPFNYLDTIQEGIRDVYTILMENKKELLNETLDNLFSDIVCRIVVRPTYLYSRYLTASYHPQYLRNGLDREKLFDMLWNIVNIQDKFRYLVEMEIKDLLNSDVPFFTFNVDKKDIYDSRNQKINNFFEKTSLDLIKENIFRMSQEDLDKQLKILAIVLGSHEIKEKEIQEVEAAKSENMLTAVNFNILESAERIGEYLINHALVDENKKFATWLGLEINNNKTFKFQSADFTLYNGIMGLSLFLAQLAEETEKNIYREYARKSVTYIVDKLRDFSDMLPNSMYNGIGSLVYTFYFLGNLWGDKELLETGDEFLDRMIDSKKEDTAIDFLDGHAGIIKFGLNLYYTNGNKKALELACIYGEDLLQRLKKKEDDFKVKKYFTGFGHGTSGLIVSLTELGVTSKNKEMLAYVQKLISYENSLFDVDSLNWLDLRESVENKTDSYFWCHGAPGILMSRSLIKHRDEAINYNAVLKNILSKKNDTRLCLCHGLFGIFDILLIISEYDSSLIKRHEIVRIAESYLENENIHLKIQGMMEKGLIGMMMGVAGVGYSLLRLKNKSIPSILTLDLPDIRGNSIVQE